MISFLPNKQLETYNEFFKQVRQLLTTLELQMSASWAMCDFEVNIRAAIAEHFPEVKLLGCHFHYGQAIWRRVVEAGLKSKYSRCEKGLSTLVRSAIGLAYVPLDRMDDGMSVLKEITSELSNGREKAFGENLVSYMERVWINGPYPPSTWNQFEHVGVTTNNFNEGYNSRLSSKKEISRHPNPFVLVDVIKSELRRADTLAMAAQVGKGSEQNKKYKKLRERKRKMMKNLRNRDIDLRSYMAAIGQLTMKCDKRIQKIDTAPGASSDPNDHTALELVNGTPQARDSLSGGALRDLRNELLQATSTASTPMPLSSSATNVTSTASTPMPLSSSATNVTSTESPPTKISTSATIVASTESTSIESTPILFSSSADMFASVESTASPLCTSAQNAKLTLGQGFDLAKQRLCESGFKLSPTQEVTPGDGNCAIHCLLDQMSHDDKLKGLARAKSPSQIRSMVVHQLGLLEATGKIAWPGHMSMEDWSKYMIQDGTYCDQVFFLLSAEVFNREIVLVPIFAEDGHDNSGLIKFTPSSFLSSQMYSPFYLLYYSDTKFVNPHFQSIRPINLNELVTSIPERSSLLSLPQMESTKDSEKKSRKRKENRELSCLSNENIVSGKRARRNRVKTVKL